MTHRVKGLFVAALSLSILLMSFLPGAALASSVIEIQGVRDVDGTLIAEFSLKGMLSGRTREMLGRGMPATLTYRIELWKTRAGWFDRLVTSKSCQYRVNYDVWQNAFLVETEGASPKRFQDIPQVETECCLGKKFSIVPLAELEKGSRYFLIINATFKPLSLEEITQMQGWLSGELRHRGEQTGGGIPRYLLGLVVNIAGLGDKSVLARTGGFSLSDLRPQ
ncbi:MAG: DUF4390 domain-containing protein [Candidatus Eisenbacteria bacterium]|nr:DUF4390 domain-containing protein [Candidatus Eisenbacteria bacterium]